ncbi:hypothetical protein VTJ04DRAFT_5980 [Mycothermus thermophilus]|uniref:uncharacterized protein n=1 Tax=Humicola insolens TaxID=85995 RepID=UPI003742912D
MDDQNPTSENVPSAAAAAGNDVSMTDAPTQQPSQSAPSTTTSAAVAPSPSPAPAPATTEPASTSASTMTSNNQTQPTPSAPAAQAAPSPAPAASSSTAAPALPTEPTPNGAPVRQYINSKITGVLLEGMKIVAKERPKDPLRVLGEYLIQRSKELEGKD